MVLKGFNGENLGKIDYDISSYRISVAVKLYMQFWCREKILREMMWRLITM